MCGRFARYSGRETLEARVATLLPPGVRVRPVQAVAEASAGPSRAYRVNLNVLALVALFTGGFLVALLKVATVEYVGAGWDFVIPTALIIIVLALVINSLTENIVAPMIMGKGLSISPTVVFLSFIFWMFILGGAGAFVAMPLTVGLVLFMNSFQETRGLAALMGNLPTSTEP